MERKTLPSAHDVARRAGVSQATVSRAFTPGATIASATRDLVIQAADAIGYRPNLLARSLIMGRSGIVGVVMGNPRNPFYMAALELLSRRLSAAGRHMLLFAGGDGDGDIPIEDLLEYRVDVLILMSAPMSSGLAARCEAEGIPVIFFNREARDLIASRSVTGTNAQGAREIAAHLLDQGYRRLAFMAGVPGSSTSHDRELGYLEEIGRRGGEAPRLATGMFERVSARAAARALLSADDWPDAIFCANDDMALATIEVARFEFGLVIGRQIGVAGFDDIDQARWPSFDLTSYSQPIEEMVGNVIAMIDNRGATRINVAGALVPRGSTMRRPTE